MDRCQQLLDDHARGDIEFFAHRPGSGEVYQGIKVANLKKGLERLFGNDLSVPQDCGDQLSPQLFCSINSVIITVKEAQAADGQPDTSDLAEPLLQQLQELSDLCNRQVVELYRRGSSAEKFQLAAYFLVRYLAIQPHSRGNGRVARLLTSLLLFRLGETAVPLRFHLLGDGQNSYRAALPAAEHQAITGPESNRLLPMAVLLRRVRDISQLLPANRDNRAMEP